MARNRSCSCRQLMAVSPIGCNGREKERERERERDRESGIVAMIKCSICSYQCDN